MIYISNDFNTIFFVNYKCCFSSFERLRKEGKVQKLKLDFKITKSVNFYILVRHPMSKLLSFFNDKFIASINNKLYNKQMSQLTMCNFYDRNKLYNINMKFSDFVQALRQGYRNCHINLQSDILKNVNFLNSQNKHINVIKLEDHNFHQKISSLLGCEFIQVNSTKTMPNIDKKAYLKDISKKDLDFIYLLYKEDFDRFGYSKI